MPTRRPTGATHARRNTASKRGRKSKRLISTRSQSSPRVKEEHGLVERLKPLSPGPPLADLRQLPPRHPPRFCTDTILEVPYLYIAIHGALSVAACGFFQQGLQLEDWGARGRWEGAPGGEGSDWWLCPTRVTGNVLRDLRCREPELGRCLL